jgi:hypothetical protein
MRLVALVLAVALATILTACSSTGSKGKHKVVLPPRAIPPNTDGFSAVELQDAGKLFRAKCLRCHEFYDPASYSNEDWQMWMGKMTKKAKLKPDQAEILSRYLDCFRASSAPQRGSAESPTMTVRERAF